MFSMLTHISGWKALIAMVVLGAIASFLGGMKFVKVAAWSLIAVIGVFAAWNEIKQ